MILYLSLTGLSFERNIGNKIAVSSTTKQRIELLTQKPTEGDFLVFASTEKLEIGFSGNRKSKVSYTGTFTLEILAEIKSLKESSAKGIKCQIVDEETIPHFQPAGGKSAIDLSSRGVTIIAPVDEKSIYLSKVSNITVKKHKFLAVALNDKCLYRPLQGLTWDCTPSLDTFPIISKAVEKVLTVEWLKSLSQLRFTVLDQNVAGHFMTVQVSGTWLLSKVPDISDKLIEVSINGDLYYAYRESNSFFMKLAWVLSSGNKGKDLELAQFQSTHHNNIVGVLERSTIKVSERTIDAMFAWCHMSSLDDNVLGLTERVAQDFFNLILKHKLVRSDGLTKETLLSGIKDYGLSILNGVTVYGFRQPITPPGGAVSLPIQVVSNPAYLVGVSLNTAKNMGGDFDHDLFFWGLGTNLNSIENAVEMIKKNIFWLDSQMEESK